MGNLDLVAESVEEAQAWIQGIKALMENMENMDESTKLDQYPCYKKDHILYIYSKHYNSYSFLYTFIIDW